MTPVVEPKPSNQAVLLGQRRFGPFFLTQFLTAANDNLLKFALTLLASAGLIMEGMPLKWAGPAIGMVFLLTFVLCSAVVGPWIDKQDKARLMRQLKLLEIGIMALAAMGLWSQQSWPLLLAVMGLGVQAACFGPAKYAYIPEQLRTRELMGGNGIALAGTYLAMLLGHVVGAALVDAGGQHSALWVGGVCLSLAVLGWVSALWIPPAPSQVPQLVLLRNPLAELARSVAAARRDPSLFQALIGLGWMWFIAAFYLTQLPILARDVLGAGPTVVAMLLAVFGLGLLIASLFAEIMARQHVEIGLVLIGAMGMGSFGGDLYFSTYDWPMVTGAPMLDVAAFWASEGSGRIMYDLFRLSLGLGLFAAPLFALIQWRAQPGQCARLMALGNLINALFLLVGVGVSVALLRAGLTLPQLFIVGAVFNSIAVLCFFVAMPESLVRLTVMSVTRFMYRVRARGHEAWPLKGPAVLVCNHVSLLDVMFVTMLSPRPLVVLGDPAMHGLKGLRWFFKRIPAMPLVHPDVDPEAHEAALAFARRALDEGQLVCVFPEGRITPDGQLQAFMDVLPAIVQQRAVPVFPAALYNLWGSYFSRIDGEPMRKPLRRGFYNLIGLRLGPALSGPQASTERLHAEVSQLLKEPKP